MSEMELAQNEDPRPQPPEAGRPAEAELPDQALIAALQQLEAGLAQKLSRIETRLGSLESGLDAVTRQVSFLPPQVRSLSGKVEGMSSLLSDSHYQTLLLRLLTFSDLLNQLLLNQSGPESSTAPGGAGRELGVLKTQLRQILEANGLSEIEASGAFNPELHRSIAQVPCPDLGQHGQIVEVLRPGFRTERSILRFAEVTVGVYLPDQNEMK